MFIKSSPYCIQKSYSKFIKLSFYLLLFSLSILFCFFLFPYCSCSSAFCSFVTVSLLYPVFCFFCYSIFILLCPYFSVFFYLIYMFLYFFLLILKICYTFAAMNVLAMTYQTTIAQQRNFNLFAFFSALYLVVSDILLTHTHTHRRY